MTVNRSNIDAMIGRLRATDNPITIQMGTWGPEHEGDGLVCCVAGLACLTKNGKYPDDPAQMRSIASEYIGVIGMDAYNLFTPDSWTGAYITDSEGVINVLSHLKDTGVVQWSRCKDK